MKTALPLALLATPGLALAHPGAHHGDLAQVVAHFLASAQHMLPLLVSVVCLGILFAGRRKAAQAKRDRHDPR